MLVGRHISNAKHTWDHLVPKSRCWLIACQRHRGETFTRTSYPKPTSLGFIIMTRTRDLCISTWPGTAMPPNEMLINKDGGSCWPGPVANTQPGHRHQSLRPDQGSNAARNRPVVNALSVPDNILNHRVRCQLITRVAAGARPQA